MDQEGPALKVSTCAAVKAGVEFSHNYKNYKIFWDQSIKHWDDSLVTEVYVKHSNVVSELTIYFVTGSNNEENANPLMKTIQWDIFT